MNTSLLRISLILSFVLTISACGSKPEEPSGAAPADAKPQDRGGLQNETMNIPADNPITPEKVELGKMLFFDTRLSKTGKLACESCHHPENGWTAGKALTAKFDGKMNTRMAPSLNNVGYFREWYWDGRGKTLEGVATAAWKNQMGADPELIAKNLNEIPGYKEAFQKATGGPATPDAIAKSLATFMRTIKSDNSQWDRCDQGGEKSPVCEELTKGFEVFSHQNKANCTLCHLPPLYTDTLFHNVGIGSDKKTKDPGRGKILEDAAKDAGTKDEKAAEMMGAFKTPTLRGIAVEGPYFHDGSAAKLEDAVDVMLKGGIPNDNLDPKLRKRNINRMEYDQLLAFIRSLTPEQKPFEKPKLP